MKVPARHMDCRPLGAGELAVMMEKTQEEVWLLVISLSCSCQTLPIRCVQWHLRAEGGFLVAMWP